MLTESTKRLRDPLALGLLAAAALYLIAILALLFKDEFGFDFADRAFYLQDQFTNPVWVLVILAAVALVTMGGEPGERTPMARTVSMVALALLTLMLVLGIITWLVGYGGDEFELTGKITGTLLTIARLVLLAIAAFLTLHLFRSMPAQMRQHQQQHQQWGPHGGQGGPQYGQQADLYGHQGHGGGGTGAGVPAAGGAAWGHPQGAYAGPPGQQGAYAPGGEQAPWGQTQQSPPQSSQQEPQQSTSQEQAAWGRPVGEPTQEPAAWSPPGPPQQQQPGWTDPDATVVRPNPRSGSETPASEPAADPDQQAREDDQRPGWWAPGS